MSGRSNGKLAVLAAVTLTGGCVQAMRHSNTMLFGTNTSFGIKAGTGATQTPAVQIGYDRQEAVVLPLVANVAERQGGKEGLLSPCNVGADVVVNGREGGFPVHPCVLVASNGASTDSYSVLASFGAKFGASAPDGAPEAQGGLAQYFATGMAAQILATTGGASVVNSAAEPTDSKGAQAVGALFGTPDQRARGVKLAQDYGAFKQKLVGKIGAEADATLPTNLGKFETRIGSKELSPKCGTLAPCLVYLADPASDPFSDAFFSDSKKLNDAIDQWGK